MTLLGMTIDELWLVFCSVISEIKHKDILYGRNTNVVARDNFGFHHPHSLFQDTFYLLIEGILLDK
jgi:hypothetical protein